MSPINNENKDNSKPSISVTIANVDIEPATKKARVSPSETANQQSSLLNFFHSSSNKKKQSDSVSAPPESKLNENDSTHAAEAPSTISENPTASQIAIEGTAENRKEESIDPIVPTKVETSSSVIYQSLHNNHVIVRKPKSLFSNENVRTKVAAFDLDGTVVKWISDDPGFWPSQLGHFELWNTDVITKLRSLYDNENYLLVIFTNQGGVQSAHNGKRATLVKTILDWLEYKIDRPVCAIASTKSIKKSKESFHKPQPHMWQKVLAAVNGPFGQGKGLIRTVPTYDLKSSFFVGDSADEDDAQGGVDRKFAANVGIDFYTPDEYFGPSHQELRKKLQQVEATGGDMPAPERALQARKALLGGYLGGPILLILTGVQGSGKSTFCRQLLEIGTDRNNENGNTHWVWLSQDTINNGKPGKREKVEDEATKTLQQGHSVVIDRMHLDPGQRKYFVDVAKQCQVPAHIVLFNPPTDIVSERVRNRTNHPGKVEGENGVKLAMRAMAQLIVPSYEEGVDLITCASTDFSIVQLAERYRCCGSNKNGNTMKLVERIPFPMPSSSAIPTISLGTMGMGRRQCTEFVKNMLSAGFCSFDTAPTYKNEDKVGEALGSTKDEDLFVIAKIPKRASTPDQVRSELEATLSKLQRDYVDLLLLHWPSDVILGKSLADVWQCMEECFKAGKCKSLGVCNFNQGALTMLLKTCKIPPVVNQVERHPLLSQMDLVDFCARNNILIQAHTPLGQGNDELLKNPIIVDIASDLGLSPAQVLIRWNLQQGVIVTPKCSQEGHAKEILSLLSPESQVLSPDDMKILDRLDRGMRFVAPPFMYGTNVYCWGERMPIRE